ncbi:hypothetical protein L3Y34_006349 [Caenorhabditis briggsae]|uniref:Uncharacterized protein n=1 Tax=Caenorhabditis briggsae TaxID=6238 RepID=A0AAE9CYD2_CAEBR|nr:hypothetical protein L3Y34_006349 [Caenorhabditis briggsae]
MRNEQMERMKKAEKIKRQNLANAFISTTIFSAMPGILMTVPVGLTFGGFCAIVGAKISIKLAENAEKPKIDEDSGI